jgi:hypothetical protein
LTSFVALYRGETVGAAKMVAVSAEPALVRDFATRMLAKLPEDETDTVIQELEQGRRRALELVRNEAGR